MHLRSFDFTLLAALATSLAATSASHAAGVAPPPPPIASATLGQPGGQAQLGTDGTLLLVPRVTLGGTMTFSGADTVANHGLYTNHAVFGTSTTPNAAVYEFNVLTDKASTTNYFNGLTLNYTMGTAGGGRGGIDVQFGITQQPTTSVGSANYVGALQVGAATVNVGGTATTSAGGLFGNNPNVRLAENATYWTTVNAQENDVSMLVGTSATSVFGQSIVHGQNTVVHGSIDDAALAFADQENVSARWLYGISFGTHQAQWPMDPGGTIIGAIARTIGPLVAPVQALNGVDFRAVAFQSGGKAFASHGFAVDPAGNISANSLITPTITNTGSVTAITVNWGGYTLANVLPTVTVAAPASGAAALAAVTHLGWTGDGVASLTNAGAGCAVGDHLTAVGATGTGFAINVTAIGTGGTVTAYSPGGAGDTTAPYPAASVTLSGGTCTTAPVMTAHLYITQFGVTAGGSGYTTAPAVTVSAEATATAIINATQTLTAAAGQMVLSSMGTQLGVAGTAGKPVVGVAAQADQAYARIAAVNGGSSSFAANVSEHFLDPSAALSSYADTLPATPVDGQTADISCGQTITTLTVSVASGQTLRPSSSSVATSCSETQGHRWKYRAGQLAWNQIY